MGYGNVTGAQAAQVLSVQSPLTVGRQAPSLILTYFSPAQTGGSCDYSHLEGWVDQEPLLVLHSGPCSISVASPQLTMLPLCSQEYMELVVSLSSHLYFSHGHSAAAVQSWECFLLLWPGHERKASVLGRSKKLAFKDNARLSQKVDFSLNHVFPSNTTAQTS